MGADCKSAGLFLRWFESDSAQIKLFGIVTFKTYLKNFLLSLIKKVIDF